MSDDGSVYGIDSVPLFQLLYGKNLISLGGTAAIDNMFSDLKLNGLKLLDLGFGLGGVAFHLAQKFDVAISGIEIYPWMAQYATENKPKHLGEKLSFHVYDEHGKMPFSDQSFDIVYSKGVLNHVKEKLPLFKNIYQVLKAGGQFVIADWIFPEFKQDSGPLVFETKETYQDVLMNAGFENIDFRNDSKQFYSYVQSFISNLATNQFAIESEFGAKMYSDVLEQHQSLLKAFDAQERQAVRIIAQRLTSI